MIYVPTRARTHVLRKTLPVFASQGQPVFVAVIKDEVQAYQELIDELQEDLFFPVEIIEVPNALLGVSHARNTCIDHATSMKYEAIVMSDDDVFLEDINSLLIYAEENKDCGGVACYFPIYSHFLGLPPNQGVVEHRGSLAQVAYGLRVDNLNEVGRFNEKLHRKEDYDLRVKMLLAGYKWYIHTDSRANQAGKQYAPGGIKGHGAKTGLTQKQMEWDAHLILTEEYGPGLFTWTKSGKAYVRANWRKIHDMFDS